MSKRELSQTPSAVRARERRFDAWLTKEEAKWHAEINTLMEKGMSFDEAWVAAGGLIIDDLENAGEAA
jgi:hypothetical protein